MDAGNTQATDTTNASNHTSNPPPTTHHPLTEQEPCPTNQPDKPALPTHDWFIRTKDDPTQRLPVHAAYHDDDSDFIRFKDGHHKTIYMIAVDQVLDIGRLDPQHRTVGPDGRLHLPTKHKP